MYAQLAAGNLYLQVFCSEFRNWNLDLPTIVDGSHLCGLDARRSGTPSPVNQFVKKPVDLIDHTGKIRHAVSVITSIRSWQRGVRLGALPLFSWLARTRPESFRSAPWRFAPLLPSLSAAAARKRKFWVDWSDAPWVHTKGPLSQWSMRDIEVYETGNRKIPIASVVAWTLLLSATWVSPVSAHFHFEQIAERAKKLAEQAYQPPEPIPEWLGRITYDQWRDIRYRPDRSLWRDSGLPFQVQFFHPGYYYRHAVSISVVDDTGVHPVAFSPGDFDYGRNDFASRVPHNLGFAGFRVHAPIKRADYYDEVIVFLGASYFRAVGRDEVFGLSARGLAIDTGLPSGEEFPSFREYWIVRPVRWATDLVVYAILDSPSVAGAYRFVVRPGEQTRVDVEARLFFRREVQQLGLAPLTSMFFHGEHSSRPVEDFRPEVHDSDGLLLHFRTGEWLWRPLLNPRTLQISSFRMQSPRGFGLLQRDRNFDHYQDLETRRDRRPSAWVELLDDWGPGRVVLVEIPTKSDTNDNIVAFWVPDAKPKTTVPLSVRYRLWWYGDDPARPPGGRALATRRDRGNREDAYRIIVDFGGGELESLPADTVLHGAVSIASGAESAELLDQQVVKNPVTGGWRLAFQIRPKRNEPIELRAYLMLGDRVLTETWSYLLVP